MPANNSFIFRPLRTNLEAETQDRKEIKKGRQADEQAKPEALERLEIKERRIFDHVFGVRV